MKQCSSAHAVTDFVSTTTLPLMRDSRVSTFISFYSFHAYRRLLYIRAYTHGTQEKYTIYTDPTVPTVPEGVTGGFSKMIINGVFVFRGDAFHGLF